MTVVKTTYNKLSPEQQERAINQYIFIRSIEEEISEEEYVQKHSKDYMEGLLKEKNIEVDDEDEDYLYVDL